MDFDLTEEQSILQDSVERLLTHSYDFETRRKYMAEPDGWSREQWRRYADMGLLALPFAEEEGGFDGGAAETMIVMEQFGRALVLEPYLATVVVGGSFLRLGGSPAQKAELIPAIAEGRLLLAFAQAERQSRYELADVRTTATRDGEHWIITGAKRYVLHGDSADKLIVTVRVDGAQRDRTGLGVFIVDANASGVTRRGYTTQDRLRAADVVFDEVRVGPEAVIGQPGEALPLIERVVDIATAALCAEAVGAIAMAHEVTIDYLKTRQQFGRAIGSFQVLQHRAVDMLIQVEKARSLTMHGMMMSEEADALERTRAVSATKIQIGRSGRYVAAEAVQMHGGIGMTDEYIVGHYYRRLTVIELLFGDTNHHITRLADAGGLIEAQPSG